MLFERFPPLPHLADLRCVGVLETFGRERRQRYFTLASYRSLVASENLLPESTKYTEISFDKAGDFCHTDPALFFDGTAESLAAFVDQFGSDGPPDQRKLNRSLKPTKAKIYKNPVAADGTRVRGRPRKEWAGSATKRKGKPASDDELSDDGQADTKKSPRRDKGKQRQGSDINDDDKPVEPPAKRPRGRPRKNVAQAASPRKPAKRSANEANPADDDPLSPTKTTVDPAPAVKRRTRGSAPSSSPAKGKNKVPNEEAPTAGNAVETITKPNALSKAAKVSNASQPGMPTMSSSRPTPRRRREANPQKAVEADPDPRSEEAATVSPQPSSNVVLGG